MQENMSESSAVSLDTRDDYNIEEMTREIVRLIQAMMPLNIMTTWRASAATISRARITLKRG